MGKKKVELQVGDETVRLPSFAFNRVKHFLLELGWLKETPLGKSSQPLGSIFDNILAF